MTGEYLASPADCETPASYYYSCECGEKGTATFEHGDPLGHDFSAQNATEEYLCSLAGAEHPATYYYSCIRCGKAGTETFEHGDSLLSSEAFLEFEVLSEWEKICKVVGMKAGSSERRIVIPHSYNGYSVVSIGDHAFYGCSSLTLISIPSSVTSIGSDAFYGCSSLESIAVDRANPSYRAAGNCLIEIATKVLVAGCKTSVIPSDGSVTTIGSYAFQGCSSLESISIPSSVTTIGYRAFYGCSSLASVSIPEGVTSIESSAFYGCSSLASIAIPSSVTSIGGGSAFSGCSSLESISVDHANRVYRSAGNCLIETRSKELIAGCTASVIPSDGSVASIGSYAFYGRSSLASVSIPEGVTSIGWFAFSGCSSLASVSIPSGVTTIEDGAFYGCSSLESISIPSSVTSIGERAFYDCSSLESISVDHANRVYRSAGNCLIETRSKELIAGCTASVIPSDGSVASIGSYAFYGRSFLTSISIPYGVTTIKMQAFEGCSSLTSISISSSVTSIDNRAFSYCPSLESIAVDPTNRVYRSAGNCLIATASKTLRAGCKASVIPTDGSVTSIGYCAFWDCSSLTSISIPSSVTTIGDYAFFGCSSLESISIPSSVISIGVQAFSYCPSVESIFVDPANPCYRSAGNCLIGAAKALVAGCKVSVIPADGSVTSIGSDAFSDCSTLTSISIPSSVTSIGGYAFSGCTSLASISIPSSVTSIGGYAFSHCSSLTDIYYSGTEAQWNAIEGRRNIPSGATVHFNS